MKPTRLNLTSSVRYSLTALKYSTVLVVNAVNAALGQLAVEVTGEKTGNSSANVKKNTYRVSVSQTAKATGKLSEPLLFDAWHTKVAQAEALAAFENIEIPSIFVPWLDRFAIAKTEEPAAPVTEQEPSGVPATEQEPAEAAPVEAKGGKGKASKAAPVAA